MRTKTLLWLVVLAVLLAGCGSTQPKAEFDVGAVKEYLDLNFSGTVWYSAVETLENAGDGLLEVHTDIYPDAEGKQIAMDVCRKIAANVAEMGVDRVAVLDQDGKVLGACP